MDKSLLSVLHILMQEKILKWTETMLQLCNGFQLWVIINYLKFRCYEWLSYCSSGDFCSACIYILHPFKFRTSFKTNILFHFIFTLSHHVTSHHIMSHHIMSCHVLSYLSEVWALVVPCHSSCQETYASSVWFTLDSDPNGWRICIHMNGNTSYI